MAFDIEPVTVNDSTEIFINFLNKPSDCGDDEVDLISVSDVQLYIIRG